jgi:hypothetical protein
MRSSDFQSFEFLKNKNGEIKLFTKGVKSHFGYKSSTDWACRYSSWYEALSGWCRVVGLYHGCKIFEIIIDDDARR